MEQELQESIVSLFNSIYPVSCIIFKLQFQMLLLLLFALYLTDFVYKYRSVNESSYCFISQPLPCIDYHLPFTQD